MLFNPGNHLAAGGDAGLRMGFKRAVEVGEEGGIVENFLLPALGLEVVAVRALADDLFCQYPRFG